MEIFHPDADILHSMGCGPRVKLPGKIVGPLDMTCGNATPAPPLLFLFWKMEAGTQTAGGEFFLNLPIASEGSFLRF